MDLDIGVNPFAAVDAVFDISGNQSRADQQIAHSEQQRYLDNRYRTEQDILNRQRYEEQKQRQDTYLTRLAKDAKVAGISLNAALGGPGYSPVNVSLPAGQGGRVSGTYQRGSSASILNAMQLRTSLAVAKKTEAEADSAKIDNLVKIGVIKPYDPPTMEEIPPVPKMQSGRSYYYDHGTGKTIEWLDERLAESLDSVGSWFYMGLQEAEKNLREFWQQSKQFRHQKMYGE